LACNWELMNYARYDSPHIVKGLLRRKGSLTHYARKGDSVAHSILIDLNDAMDAEGVLTFKQRKYLKLWLDGHRQIDIAAMHRTSQDNVAHIINRATRNISIYLV